MLQISHEHVRALYFPWQQSFYATPALAGGHSQGCALSLLAVPYGCTPILVSSAWLLVHKHLPAVAVHERGQVSEKWACVEDAFTSGFCVRYLATNLAPHRIPRVGR